MFVQQCPSSSRAASEDTIAKRLPIVNGYDGAATAPAQVRTDPVLFKLALQVLVDNAVAATRNETVEFAFRGDESHLRFEIKGMTSNQVAQRLTAMFDNAIALGGANDENHRALLSVRQYLNQIGGDVYMRSRPGRASEFIASVPLERFVKRFELTV